MIKDAAKYLHPQDNTKRKCRRPDARSVKEARRKTELTLEYLRDSAVSVKRPTKRSECPVVRPCPFVSCRYHLYLDVTDSGSIKYNFDGLDPDELTPSCAIDAAERAGKMTLKDIGDRMGLTRERIRQIESQALDKLACEIDITEINLYRSKHDSSL